MYRFYEHKQKESTMKSTKVIFPAVLSILVGLTAVLQAGVVSQHYTFSAPEVMETENGVKVLMKDTRLLGFPGEPLLPIFGAVLLLPPGEAVERVEIIPGDLVTIPGNYFVFPICYCFLVRDSTTNTKGKRSSFQEWTSCF